ncbi:GGDEF domain-containing protein [Rhizobium sp. BK376]|uniref:GGDEF domain-containing protein n=1 Tax=Rhizobium sp. BK376 TaxID=2512149 RepID=UPI0010442AEF|nr:GGDEF domain-containing protein [Rhizobium sp. BK376]TCR90953.1 diguanylate cyclase (GGDEF)-like protein [Rhizobium sp. BK376]
MNPRMSIALGRSFSPLTMKIFSICFVATHAPLLVLAGYLAIGYASDPIPVLVTVLSATLVGTIFCLYSVWRLIQPLQDIVTMIDAYRSNGTVKPMTSSPRQDEIGRVVNGVSALIVELDATLSQLRRQASTDVLTGLGNRRWLREIVGMELQRASREKTPFSVIILDLDHFKRINDQFGHDVGDQVLMMTGATIQHSLRPYDIAARIGGEEFCIVLPRTPAAMAIAIAERLRREIASKSVGPLTAGAITASFGVYRGDPATESLKMMMTAADRKLYAAKNAGRNAVHWHVAPAFAHELTNDAGGSHAATASKRSHHPDQDTIRDGSGGTL